MNCMLQITTGKRYLRGLLQGSSGAFWGRKEVQSLKCRGLIIAALRLEASIKVEA